jgi:hypothetical protein
LLDVVRKSPKKTGPAEIWILSGILWAFVGGALHLSMTIRMAIDTVPLVNTRWS